MPTVTDEFLSTFYALDSFPSMAGAQIQMLCNLFQNLHVEGELWYFENGFNMHLGLQTPALYSSQMNSTKSRNHLTRKYQSDWRLPKLWHEPLVIISLNKNKAKNLYYFYYSWYMGSWHLFFFSIQFKVFLILGMMNDFQLKPGYIGIILLWILFKPPILAGFSWQCPGKGIEGALSMLMGGKCRSQRSPFCPCWHWWGWGCDSSLPVGFGRSSTPH